MRKTIKTRSFYVAMASGKLDRAGRIIGALAVREVGPPDEISARNGVTLEGVCLRDVDVAVNGTGEDRRAARMKIMAARGFDALPPDSHPGWDRLEADIEDTVSFADLEDGERFDGLS